MGNILSEQAKTRFGDVRLTGCGTRCQFFLFSQSLFFPERKVPRTTFGCDRLKPQLHYLVEDQAPVTLEVLDTLHRCRVLVFLQQLGVNHLLMFQWCLLQVSAVQIQNVEHLK